MKVGITIPKIDSLYSCGITFNILLWYDFFQNCGFDVLFLTYDKNTVSYGDYKFANFYHLWSYDEMNQCKIIENYKEKYPEIFELDIIFSIGLGDLPFFKLIQMEGIKLIYIVLGSVYHNDVHCMIDSKFPANDINHISYDEIWISPHFKYCQEYYKIKWNCKKVFICPYLWRDDLLIKESIKDKILTDIKDLKVAIVEPNLEQAKNCIIPIAICEKAINHIKNIMIFNTFHLKENGFFKPYVTNMQIHKQGKVTCEKRYPLPIILSEYCNCVISYVEDCDLNYVFLECFYLGVPLIHNSPMLKDYGYYYPRLNVSKGAEQVINVVNNHNKEEYIKKHKPLIDKYSVTNPLYIEWAKGRLNNTIDYDCDI